MKNFLSCTYSLIMSTLLYQICFYILSIVGIFAVFIFSKAESFIFINSHNSICFDYIFKYITYLGDKYFVLIIIMIAFLFKRKIGIELLLIFFVTIVVVYVLKNYFFADVLRPVLFLKNTSIHFVEGIEVKQTHSFPSAHAAISFSMLLYLSTKYSHKIVQLVFLLMGLLVAYSRLYLGQHFLLDVVFGALIGNLISIVSIAFINNFNKLEFIKMKK